MRLIKAVGLLAIAVFFGTAMVGAGTAAADEIVLCKQLVANGSLCPTNEFFPAGTKLLALASNPELTGDLLTVKCPDSLSTITPSISMGHEPAVSITVEFGKLPTPALGSGCTDCSEIHTSTYSGKIIAVPNGSKDDWYLLTSGFAELLHCTIFNVTCKFGSEHLKLPIDLDATLHALRPTGTEFKGDLLLINKVSLENKGSGLCGASGLWTASYTTYGCDEPGKGHADRKPCWLALYATLAVEGHEVSICKELLEKGEVCLAGQFYPAGTRLLALAGSIEFKASPFSAMKCEDSVIEGETTSSMGLELGIKITKFEVGKLPTPTLGEGCTTCTGGVHTAVPLTGAITVSGEDDFILTSSGAVEVLNCFGLGITCVYGSDNLKSLVDVDAGSHPLATGEQGLAQILVVGTLEYVKGSNFCPEKGTWTANYVVYALESEGKKVQGWLGLYERL